MDAAGRLGPTMKLAALLLVTLAIAGCLGPSGRRSVTTPDGGTQDRYCQNVSTEACDRAVSRAQALALGMSESPKALVAAVDTAADGDLIVAFAPVGDGEVWSPPILRVVRHSSPHWTVDYWKTEPVPEAFARLMADAGLDRP